MPKASLAGRIEKMNRKQNPVRFDYEKSQDD
jgi:hypothetical protein